MGAVVVGVLTTALSAEAMQSWGWRVPFVIGMLIAPVVFLEPNMMGGVLIYGFAAAVVGGLSSPLGAVVGGFLVGVFENL
eukprot:gene12596-16792_t